MTVSQKYTLLYKQNIMEINLGTLSSYNISSHNIGELLNDISIPNYISFKIVSSKEEQSNLLNKNYYKGRNTLMLQMIFNQHIIIKNVILQVFLNEPENNDIGLIKNDILKQVGYYYNNNVVINSYNIIERKQNDNHETTSKNQMKNSNNDTIIYTNDNINENAKFKEKFLESMRK